MNLWDRFRQLYLLPEVLGISIRRELGTYTYTVCHIQRQQGQIASTYLSHGDGLPPLLTELEKYAKVPIALHIEGRGILMKEYLGTGIDEDRLPEMLPSYTSEDYHYASLEGETKTWVAFVQRSVIDEISEQLAPIQTRWCALYIGPFVLDALLPLLSPSENEPNRYELGRHLIYTTEDFTWSDYQYRGELTASKLIKVDGSGIQERYIAAYAVALNTLLLSTVDNSYALPIKSRIQCLHRIHDEHRFKINMVVTLVITFLVLLANMLILHSYEEKIEDLQSTHLALESSQIDIATLRQSVSYNDSLLHELGWSEINTKAFVLDQLGHALAGHEGLTIREIRINLPTKKQDDSELSRQSYVGISGVCDRMEALTQWISSLRQLNWVKSAELEQFTTDKESSSDEKSFYITIVPKPRD